MKKIFIPLMAVAALMAACTNDDQYDISNFNGTDTLNIVFNGETATVSGEANFVTTKVEGANVTVTSHTQNRLVMRLSGSSNDGQLLIYAQKKMDLLLDNLQLTNADGPAINNQCGKALHVVALAGTTNTLCDGETYAEAPKNELGETIDQKGTLFSEGQIYFEGTGTLAITAKGKNAVATDDYVVVREPLNLNIDVAQTGASGIKAKDSIDISNGNITINVASAGGRGINDDGILNISGGTINITTSGDCVPETASDGTVEYSSAAGIKCDSTFVMTGGTLTIASSGDGGKGVNCDRNFYFKGGSLTVTTTGTKVYAKPKGVKSDTEIIISGGSFESTTNKSKAVDSAADSEFGWPTIIGTPKEKIMDASNDNYVKIVF